MVRITLRDRVCVLRVQVLQYNPSLEVVTPASTTEPSDPSMVLVPSVYRYTSDIRFYTSSVNVGGTVTTARNYLTIVTTDAARATLTLDNTPIGQYS